MFLSTLFSAVSVFLLARWLGPGQFGLYGTVLAITAILTDAVDLALSGTIVNFGAKDHQLREGLLKYGFLLKLGLGLFLGGFLTLISAPLANWLNRDLLRPLRVVAVLTPILLMHRFPRSILQAKKHFLADSILEVIASLSRLLVLWLIYLAGRLNLINGILSYFGSYLATFLIGAKLISWNWLKAAVNREVRQNFHRFQKWLTFGFILAAVHGRIDNAILVKYAGPAAAGIYQAATRFFLPVVQLTAALTLVFAPRFASFASATEARTYLHKGWKLTGLLSGLVLLIIPLAPLFVDLIYGQNYQAAIAVTRILSWGYASFIAVAPFSAYLIYSQNRTRAFAVINLVQLVLILALNLLLVPSYQAVGAAWAMTLTLTSVNLLIVIMAVKP
jgi:O-antigen/teichoic acid export membrane protein